MTLTATNATPTQSNAELLDILRGMSVNQQNVIRQGYNAYSKRQTCFWVKFPATKADVQSLMPEYVIEVAPNQFKLTDLGVSLYRAWLTQPHARANADKQPATYHGTHLGRNRNLRDMWEQKLPSNGLPALTPEPEVVPVVAPVEVAAPTPTQQPVSEPAPVSPSPAVLQLDLTAFIQPLLAQIAALETKLAEVSTPPAPQPRPHRKSSRAAMPMTVLV